MTYAEAERFLFEELTNYLRTGSVGSPDAGRPTRAKILRLLGRLGHPHARPECDFVHVGGTNGKGTVSTCIASISSATGVSTGLYTSPHYVRFTERIRVDGEEISPEAVVAFCERYRDDLLDLRCSFFEATAAMAFWYFRERRVERAVVEVGLGGTWDATNVIRPSVSIVTNIGYDHTEVLGSTLDRIAAEKVAIAKSRSRLLVGRWQGLPHEIFAAHCEGVASTLAYAEECVQMASDGRGFYLRDHVGAQVAIEPQRYLAGPYAVENVRTAVAATRLWRGGCSVGAVERGLEGLSDYGFKGRMQTVQRSPLVIADAAHNPEAWAAILPVVASRLPEGGTLRVVCGFKRGKTPDAFFRELPQGARLYLCEASALAMPVGQVLAKAAAFDASDHETVASALTAALNAAGANDLLFIGGSSYVVGDALAYFEART